MDRPKLCNILLKQNLPKGVAIKLWFGVTAYLRLCI